METIAVSKLRSNMMRYLKDIEHGKTYDITSRGKVIARIVPPDYEKKQALKKLEKIAKTAVIGDIVSPLEDDWEVNSL